jgi:hypothetical protein
LSKLEGPLGQLEQAIFHVAHLKVRVVLAERVYRFLHKHRLDEVESVTQLHHRNQLVEVKIQRFLEY